MKNIIMLSARDCEADERKIEETCEDNLVYVLDNRETLLYQYLDYLYDECGLPVEILHRLRICKQQEFTRGSVTLIQRGEERSPGSVAELLGMLDEQERASIVIETDDRVLLANILQQLIYIDYPITRVDMKLRKEYKDAEKTKRFMDRVDSLQASAKKAADLIAELLVCADEKNAEELLKIRADAITAYSKIGEQIEKARGVEMKVAVAASKKTGKSIIVNSMLGMELAPTSIELATPNNCIYRKSGDGKFHLEYNGSQEDYSGARELHQRINREFKAAERNAGEGFAIPDMLISYASEGSNFDSYTIYDTPGPDAAGTIHEKAAEAAVEQCDVAVFAIDYSKYLIPTEVEYLSRIKDIFEEKGKFHSLIFVINKLDLALADKGSKSRVKSIDFIRRRLRDIDERYGDCVIFATSAQDYFYTVEMERAARDGEPFAPSLFPLTQPGADLYRGLADVLKEFRRDMGADLRTVLSNLQSQAGQLENQLEYKDLSLQGIKDYSGMPQLMSHIAYVAQGKAREEIVNGVTFAIDQQQRSLQDIINRVTNLESLMNANGEQIRRIKEILDDFRREIEPWLRPAVTRAETKADFFRADRALEAEINELGGRNGFPVDLKKALQAISVDIEKGESESDILEGIWSGYKSAQKARIKKARGKEYTTSQLERVLSLPSDEFSKVITDYLEDTLEEHKKSVDKDTTAARDCLQEILRGRLAKLREATAACQEQLDKTGVSLQLPAMPEFDCAISLPTFSTSGEFRVFVSMESETEKLFHKYNPVKNFFLNLFGPEHSMHDKNGYVRKDISDAELDKAVNNVHKEFSDAVKKAGIYKKFRGKLAELAENVEGVREELDRNFENITDTCQGNIDSFETMIDDRDRFQEENEALARMKALICAIQDASSDFLSVWDEIMG